VWQQQEEKHCVAELQPQGLLWQGKGCERSLAASRAAATSSPPTAMVRSVSPPRGSGSPEATSVCITTASQPTRRQQPGRNGLPKGHGVVGSEGIRGPRVDHLSNNAPPLAPRTGDDRRLTGGKPAWLSSRLSSVLSSRLFQVYGRSLSRSGVRRTQPHHESLNCPNPQNHEHKTWREGWSHRQRKPHTCCAEAAAVERGATRSVSREGYRIENLYLTQPRPSRHANSL
jgi:hypothetical protein